MVDCLNDETFMRIISLAKEGEEGRQQEPSTDDCIHDLVEEYHIITRQSTELAMKRASRIAQQVVAAKPGKRSRKVMIL